MTAPIAKITSPIGPVKNLKATPSAFVATAPTFAATVCAFIAIVCAFKATVLAAFTIASFAYNALRYKVSALSFIFAIRRSAIAFVTLIISVTVLYNLNPAIAVAIPVTVGRNPSHCVNLSSTSAAPPTTVNRPSTIAGSAISDTNVIVGFALSNASKSRSFKSPASCATLWNAGAFSSITCLRFRNVFCPVSPR